MQREDFRSLFPDASPAAVDLLGKMLQFDPRRRITVEEALKHEWLSQLHDEASEPSAPSELAPSPLVLVSANYIEVEVPNAPGAV